MYIRMRLDPAFRCLCQLKTCTGLPKNVYRNVKSMNIHVQISLEKFILKSSYLELLEID